MRVYMYVSVIFLPWDRDKKQVMGEPFNISPTHLPYFLTPYIPPSSASLSIDYRLCAAMFGLTMMSSSDRAERKAASASGCRRAAKSSSWDCWRVVRGCGVVGASCWGWATRRCWMSSMRKVGMLMVSSMGRGVVGCSDDIFVMEFCGFVAGGWFERNER